MHFEHSEALLFRILTRFFGPERVIPFMSVLAVCGGDLPEQLHTRVNIDSPEALNQWAKQNKCLFTVVDFDDTPKLVIEFFSGFKDAFTAAQAEHQRFLPPIFSTLGIPYVTMSEIEFDELVDPQNPLDFVHWLHSKIEPSVEDSIE